MGLPREELKEEVELLLEVISEGGVPIKRGGGGEVSREAWK